MKMSFSIQYKANLKYQFTPAWGSKGTSEEKLQTEFNIHSLLQI